MRVLHISSARTFGDTERHIVGLTREMSRRGHEMFVALRPTCEWHEMVGFLPPERVLQVSIRNSFGMFSARRLARFIDRLGIEVIHAHTGKDYLAANVVRKAAKDVRLVLTRHVRQPLKPFHRFALRAVDAALATSEDVRDLLNLTFAADRIFLIPRGVDVDDAGQGEHDEARRAFREFHGIPRGAALTVAVGGPHGAREFVLAANEVVKALPDSYFVIVSRDAEQRARRESLRLAKVLGLGERMKWLNEPAESHELLASADLVVSLTERGEPSHLFLEAMLAGLPGVTASNVGLWPARMLIPDLEPLILARAMVSVLENRDAAAKTAADARQVAQETFGVERMADAVEAVYTTVLNRQLS